MWYVLPLHENHKIDQNMEKGDRKWSYGLPVNQEINHTKQKNKKEGTKRERERERGEREREREGEEREGGGAREKYDIHRNIWIRMIKNDFKIQKQNV